MKRQGREDPCSTDLKKSTNPTQVAKRILCKSPFTIQTQILDRTPIWLLLDWVDDRMDWRLVGALNKRFEMVCRDNNVLPRFGVQTKWARDFKRFLSTLKFKRLYDEYPKERDSLVEHTPDDCIRQDLGLTGNGFYFTESTKRKHHAINPYRFEVRLKLVRPHNQRAHLPRKTRVLRREYGLSVTGRYKFVIGNPFDLELARQMGQAISTFQYTYSAERPRPAMCFDEHDNLYTLAKGETTTVFRKDLESPDPPMPIVVADHNCHHGRLAAGHGRLYVFVTTDPFRPPGMERVLYCYEMATGRIIETRDTCQLGWVDIMDVQQDAVVFRGEGCGTIIFRVTENGFQKQCVHKEYRRQRINQHSYIQLERFFDKVKVFIFSFVNNEIVEHFLMYCDPVCQFGRYTDNVFYVVQQHQRHVWFQERPGDEPHLLFRDNRRAAFEKRCDYWTWHLVIPTRSRSVDGEGSSQRKERRRRYKNLIDDTNVRL